MAASNARKKIGKVRSSGSIDMLAHRLSDTRRDMLINRSALYRGRSNKNFTTRQYMQFGTILSVQF